MNMRLRDKFRLLAVGLLLALLAAFAVAVPGTSSAGGAALSQDSFESDLGEARLVRGAVPRAPEHASTCFERHDPCGPGGIAPAPDASVALDTMPGAGFVKARALLPGPVREIAPHAAASLPILFRNFRE
jgi:hypothetical protein